MRNVITKMGVPHHPIVTTPSHNTSVDWVHQQLLIRERNLEVSTGMVQIIWALPHKAGLRHELILELTPT